MNMSLPEYNDKHLLTVLKEHNRGIKSLKLYIPQELLHIFDYLNYQDLLNCLLVCSHWYEIIKRDFRLMDKFRCSLTLNAGTIIALAEPPFSIIREAKVKLRSIELQDDFLDSGNSMAVLEGNRSKIFALSKILTDMKAMETITEVIVHATDTSALLLTMITKMKNVKILRFKLTALVHSLETVSSEIEFKEHCKSIDHVQIMHSNGSQFMETDFRQLLQVFPNIKRIDVTTYENVGIDSNILKHFAPLIKSVEVDTLDLDVYQHMSLNHISCVCDSSDSIEVSFIHEFLSQHREIETVCLKLYTNSNWRLLYVFPRPFNQISDLTLNISAFVKEIEDDLKLGNIIKWVPNLTKLCVKYKVEVEHEFGHDVIEMKNLIHLTILRGSFNCDTCFNAMLESIVGVKSLIFAPCRTRTISPKQINSIATTLGQLECLALKYGDSVSLQNYFAEWPAMPRLKTLIVYRVGYVTDNGISNLRQKCPMLEVIKFYSLSNSIVNSLLKLTFECFPNLKAITLRGGAGHVISNMDYLKGELGWRLKELDVSPYIESHVITQLFKDNDFLEKIRCKYGSVVVTRRIYYETEVLKAYKLRSIEQPLKNTKRLNANANDSSDNEEFFSGSSDDVDDDDDDDDDDDADEGSPYLPIIFLFIFYILLIFVRDLSNVMGLEWDLFLLAVLKIFRKLILISIFYMFLE